MRQWIAIVLVAAALLGCRAARRPPVVVAPPPAERVPPAPAVALPPSPTPLALRLDAARRARRDGDVDEAARLLAEAVALPDADLAERAWARLELGLLYADPGSPLHDADQAELHLARLAAEAPGTPAAAMGAVLRRVLAQALAAEIGSAAASASAAELGEALAVARARLVRREQELERIKEVLLGDPAP